MPRSLLLEDKYLANNSSESKICLLLTSCATSIIATPGAVQSNLRNGSGLLAQAANQPRAKLKYFGSSNNFPVTKIASKPVESPKFQD